VLAAAPAQRARAQAARGMLPAAAARVWKALAQDLRLAVDTGGEELEADEADDHRADKTGQRTAMPAAGSSPRMPEDRRDPAAGAALMTQSGAGAHEGEGDGRDAVAVPVDVAARRTRTASTAADVRDASQVGGTGRLKPAAILAPVDRAPAPRRVDRLGRDAGRGTLQAMRWGVGVAAAAMAFCMAWLLIEPRETGGEMRQAETAQRCEGPPSSCAK